MADDKLYNISFRFSEKENLYLKKKKEDMRNKLGLKILRWEDFMLVLAGHKVTNKVRRKNQ